MPGRKVHESRDIVAVMNSHSTFIFGRQAGFSLFLAQVARPRPSPPSTCTLIAPKRCVRRSPRPLAVVKWYRIDAYWYKPTPPTWRSGEQNPT